MSGVASAVHPVLDAQQQQLFDHRRGSAQNTRPLRCCGWRGREGVVLVAEFCRACRPRRLALGSSRTHELSPTHLSEDAKHWIAVSAIYGIEAVQQSDEVSVDQWQELLGSLLPIAPRVPLW